LAFPASAPPQTIIIHKKSHKKHKSRGRSRSPF
jgi:hypothetical protein